nr:hypothetical protein [uncultured Desulfobacter sp.]
MGVKISNSKFVYNGKSYFRGGSEDVNLASFGGKKTPINRPNYLSVAGTVRPKNIAEVKIKVSGPYDIQWDKYSDTDVNAGIKYLTLAGGTVGFSRKAAKKADLKLMKITIGENQLEKLLNKHANIARRSIEEEGNDGRIASAVWVVMEAKLAENISNSGSVSASLPIASSGFSIDIGTSGSSKTKSKIDIPEGTSFAYLLHKVKKWRKEKGEKYVKELEDDMQGLN